MKNVFYLLLIFVLHSCSSNTKVLDQETYDGPDLTMSNIDVLITDSTLVKLRLVAAKQYVLDNDDRDFPEGIYLEFYDVLGRKTGTLTANTGYYFAKEDYYKAEGNVHMKGAMSGDELSTELLNWVPKEERMHTDNFVTIKTSDGVSTGEGLEATEGLQEYTILKPSGTMLIKGSNKLANDNNDGFDENLVFEEDTTNIE